MAWRRSSLVVVAMFTASVTLSTPTATVVGTEPDASSTAEPPPYLDPATFTTSYEEVLAKYNTCMGITQGARVCVRAHECPHAVPKPLNVCPPPNPIPSSPRRRRIRARASRCSRVERRAWT